MSATVDFLRVCDKHFHPEAGEITLVVHGLCEICGAPATHWLDKKESEQVDYILSERAKSTKPIKDLSWLWNPVVMPRMPIEKIECTKVDGRWRVALIYIEDGKEIVRIEKMAGTLLETLQEFSWMMKL